MGGGATHKPQVARPVWQGDHVQCLTGKGHRACMCGGGCVRHQHRRQQCRCNAPREGGRRGWWCHFFSCSFGFLAFDQTIFAAFSPNWTPTPSKQPHLFSTWSSNGGLGVGFRAGCRGGTWQALRPGLMCVHGKAWGALRAWGNRPRTTAVVLFRLACQAVPTLPSRRPPHSRPRSPDPGLLTISYHVPAFLTPCSLRALSLRKFSLVGNPVGNHSGFFPVFPTSSWHQLRV